MTRAVLLTDNRSATLEMIAARARKAFSADFGAVFVRDADGDEAVVSSAQRWSPAMTELGARLLGTAPSRPRLSDLAEGGFGPAMVSSVVCIRRVHGVLLVARKAGARSFSESDLELLGPHVAEAGLAVTFAEARRELERGLLAKDRNRIARELHDGVIQSLYGIGMVLEGIRADTFLPATQEQLSRITGSINGVIDDLRAYINDLTPPMLAKRGLGPELCALANEFQTRSGVITTVRLHDGLDEIKAAVGRDLVQIAREALTNVGKHAGASHAVLSLRCTAQGIKLEISDDGRGFSLRRSSSGRGLANIVRRAEAWGGTAKIGPAGSSGTSVRILLPARTTDPPASGRGALAIAG
ncbi:MAG TPA: GAF domain-containing sensor histidine kinase [Candidatus Dormibacteraeota bacterium]|nr:GAF domain-containing sensor histidine kinase [Candidatus Dormibacteraeota bacterium]